MITIFEKDNCPQCTMTKRALTAKGVPFKTVNLEGNPEALQMVMNLGYSSAPVVVIGDVANGNHWSGLRPDRINQAAEHMAQLVAS